jgi:hypothetical protein
VKHLQPNGRKNHTQQPAHSRLRLALLAGLLLVLPIAAHPDTGSQVDVSKLGPQVGQKVPGFSLQDQNGKTQTLESIMGPKGAMLVFIRSAGW